MATYREQKEVVDSLRIREGETRRITCPFCGGTKTFTVTRSQGSTIWNCYRASCNSSGSTGAEMSPDSIRQVLKEGRGEGAKRQGIPIPEHLVSAKNSEVAIEYLKSVHCEGVWRDGLVDVRYSPAENRVLFMKPGGEGAVGRALDRRLPKWRAYGDTSGIFRIGSGNHAVVVEDAASAGSVARIAEFSGCALLGTHLTRVALGQLVKFKKVTVALDKDASQKAILIQRKLQGRVPVRVSFLEEDLKFATEHEIRSLINAY